MGAPTPKYYRRTNHTHTFTPIYDSTKQMHGKQCTGSDCGQIIWTFEQHTYERAVSYNGNSHKWVCDCGDFYLRNHNFTYAGADDSYHIIGCTDCNFANEEDHDFTYSTTYRDSLSHNISGYTSGTSPLTADMIAKLPAEIQTAILNAPQNALQNVQSNGSVSYVIPIDDECGILYLNGKYYLIYSPADPDAELQPTPSVPTEGVVS